ncbi:hypothetical protein CMUS01_04688 [Colletotrichum musicola]|uniref:LicD/FKTN/FKRP nucleotidyltransferase domain-containing protein n=1 Tax=Colletotrichum musicola TaxID=2175873 RepID=A0A8H6KVX8_9PEZI|nr:hypothetical protein CMUS01_04688 [Colletotrichum musicola]
MRVGRLLSTISVGLTLAQATPTPKDPSSAEYFQEASYVYVPCQTTPKVTSTDIVISFSEHYDARFATKVLNETAQHDAVKVLVQTYLSTLRDLGVQTWLMHGSLLGWWWNKQALPWDSDADVQVTENGIKFLAAYYNMTTWFYKYPGVPEGRFFQLEVNPNYAYRGQDDTENFVDARWIDMESGLFIDITAASYVENHPEGEGVLASKDGHEYRDTYLYPLLDTTFEGVKAKIPYKYKEMLLSEYGERALTNQNYNEFIDSKMKWVPSDEL